MSAALRAAIKGSKMVAFLVNHLGYEACLLVGHDWGAIVVWNLALMHPSRVSGIINLSVPFMERGEREWVGFWEDVLGGDFYIVHFNRQPGVADAAGRKYGDLPTSHYRSSATHEQCYLKVILQGNFHLDQ